MHLARQSVGGILAGLKPRNPKREGIPLQTLGVLGGTPEAIYFPRPGDHESSPFSCAAPPMAFPKGRDYCVYSQGGARWYAPDATEHELSATAR